MTRVRMYHSNRLNLLEVLDNNNIWINDYKSVKISL